MTVGKRHINSTRMVAGWRHDEVAGVEAMTEMAMIGVWRFNVHIRWTGRCPPGKPTAAKVC